MALSPTLGRWTQADPSGYVDGMSLYEFAVGNPVGGLDPFGLQTTGFTPADPLPELKGAPAEKGVDSYASAGMIETSLSVATSVKEGLGTLSITASVKPGKNWREGSDWLQSMTNHAGLGTYPDSLMIAVVDSRGGTPSTNLNGQYRPAKLVRDPERNTVLYERPKRRNDAKDNPLTLWNQAEENKDVLSTKQNLYFDTCKSAKGIATVFFIYTNVLQNYEMKRHPATAPGLVEAYEVTYSFVSDGKNGAFTETTIKRKPNVQAVGEAAVNRSTGLNVYDRIRDVTGFASYGPISNLPVLTRPTTSPSK